MTNICSSCGAELKKNSDFYSKCGQKIEQEPTNQNQQEQSQPQQTQQAPQQQAPVRLLQQLLLLQQRQ